MKEAVLAADGPTSARESGGTHRAATAGRFQNLAKAVLSPVTRVAWHISCEGLEHVPESGRAILAPNHLSAMDSFFVPAVLPRPIMYIGKAEYLDDWKTRWLFPALGMIPLDRSGGERSAAALDQARDVLRSDQLFGIYPEGTRSRDGKLHKGHTGVARLALDTGAPIVPVGVLGSVEVYPPDRRTPRLFRRVHVRFGAPIDVRRHLGRAGDRLLMRQITDEVMFEIARLTGQEYVDTYAGKGAPAPQVSTQPAPGSQPAPGAQPAPGDQSSTPAPAPARPSGRPTYRPRGAGTGVTRESESERTLAAAVIRTTPLDFDLV